jgi:hypothetical protein
VKETLTRKAAAILGRKGGRAGRGAAKRRGDSAYYAGLARKAAAVRAKKAALARRSKRPKRGIARTARSR